MSLWYGYGWINHIRWVHLYKTKLDIPILCFMLCGSLSGLGFEFNINISIFAKSSWMMFVKNIFISPQLTYKPLSWSFSIFTCTFSTLRCVHMKQCDIRFKKTSYLDCKQMKILMWSPRQIITGINQIIRVNMTFLKNIWTQTIILVSGAARRAVSRAVWHH